MTKELTQAGAARGIEGGSAEDFIMPKVLLIQKMSKLVEEGAVPGQLVNSLTKTQISDPTFIPIVFSKYFDLYKWNGDDKIYEGRAFSELDPRLEGRRMFNDKETGEKANVTAVMSFISLVDGSPMAIGFSKSSYKAGKKLYTFAAMSKVDLFAQKYKLLAIKKTNEKGTYFVLDVEEAGEPTKEEYALAQTYYGMFAKKIRDVHTQDEPSEVEPF